MIPRIIHYCWFGRGEMPELTQKCIDSWHDHMPNYEYKLWNEDNFDIESTKYTHEAYQAKKYAFVSDYVRLWALANEGGVYLDTDVLVFKSFDALLELDAFAGFEGSKTIPIGTCVMASVPGGVWVTEQLALYMDRCFVMEDGSFDMTTNVQFMSSKMKESGFVQNGREQNYKDLHIFPVDYFSPRHTTGEYVRTANTYCDHLGLNSWSDQHRRGWKGFVKYLVGQKNMIRLIKLKRKLFK